MTDATASGAEEVAVDESPAAGCARIFRDVVGVYESSRFYHWSDERLLREPLEAFNLDSLTLLEYVMAVEEAYSVELDEDDVNRCRAVGDLVKLVAAARNGRD
jgi:acyl carrier protein